MSDSPTQLAGKKVAFQGVPGAYSHMSCQAVMPDVEAVPYPSFEDMLTAVQQGDAYWAMVPVENSIAQSASPCWTAASISSNDG